MSYKEKARAYFSAVNNYDVAMIEQMVDEDYIQHNPFVPTGRAAFLALIPKLKTFGSRIRNRRMLEDGKHVIMHHQWENASPFGHDKMAAFHIIRFDSQSRIAEHWSIMTKDIPVDSSSLSLTDGPTQIEDIHRTHENKLRVAELFKTLTGASNKELAPLPTHFLQPDLKYHKQHKIFGEGNFTLSISEGAFFGVSSAIYDLVRFEKEKIVNHWRIAQEIPTEHLANDNTMFGFHRRCDGESDGCL